MDVLEVLVSDASTTSMGIASIKKVVYRNSFKKGNHGVERGCFNKTCIIKDLATVSEWTDIVKLVPVPIFPIIYNAPIISP